MLLLLSHFLTRATFILKLEKSRYEQNTVLHIKFHRRLVRCAHSGQPGNVDRKWPSQSVRGGYSRTVHPGATNSKYDPEPGAACRASKPERARTARGAHPA